jgi:hypothetical protein
MDSPGHRAHSLSIHAPIRSANLSIVVLVVGGKRPLTRASQNGTCALICPGETNSSGAFCRGCDDKVLELPCLPDHQEVIEQTYEVQLTAAVNSFCDGLIDIGG